MAVVIQELEVVPQAPASASQPPPAPAAAPRERPRDADLARALARRTERLARVRAH
ncbi:MAG TPA: hypothetical protein VFG59_12110 [Anaeromyxobacter sp.]|nr:hypothetical protein [Anaeromyxobacter sp.]